jgi:hypothetical protein
LEGFSSRAVLYDLTGLRALTNRLRSGKKNRAVGLHPSSSRVEYSLKVANVFVLRRRGISYPFLHKSWSPPTNSAVSLELLTHRTSSPCNIQLRQYAFATHLVYGVTLSFPGDLSHLIDLGVADLVPVLFMTCVATKSISPTKWLVSIGAFKFGSLRDNVVSFSLDALQDEQRKY